MAIMPSASSGLLRAGIGLKLSQIKRATRSYLRDRTNQASGAATSYAVAAGLFAAGGLFLVAACFVGAMALFRCIEIHYGTFWAFGAVAELSIPHQPAAPRDQVQSVAAEPDRRRPQHRHGGSAGPFGAAGRSPATAGRQPPDAGRPDPGGNAAGLGSEPATATGKTRGNLNGRPAIRAR
jgi:hypothetical protein